MLVHFYTAYTFKAHCLTYPLRVFARHLREIGIEVKLLYRQVGSLSDCDVLCISTEVLKKSPLNRQPPELYSMLEHYRQKVDTLIWFDMSAGSGTTLFSVLPYVDLYAKNQLLRDRSQYTRTYYGNRIYTEYYHQHFGIEDSYIVDEKSPAPAESLGKLAVSWNLGLGDYHTFAKHGRSLRLFWPFVNYDFPTTPYDSYRDIDTSYRVSSKYNLNTVSYQRQETRRQLEIIARENNYNMYYQGKLPYSKYRDEVSRAKIIPSPFGLGEVCFRDFECFLAGAALIKPDMSHLVTWPDYYQPGVTYVPHAWNFDDYQEKISFLLDHPTERKAIAYKGQNNYKESITNGGMAFAMHFYKIVEKAINSKHFNI